jgi:hypothetical protein
MFEADDELTLDEFASALTLYTRAVKDRELCRNARFQGRAQYIPANLNGGQPEYFA